MTLAMLADYCHKGWKFEIECDEERMTITGRHPISKTKVGVSIVPQNDHYDSTTIRNAFDAIAARLDQSGMGDLSS